MDFRSSCPDIEILSDYYSDKLSSEDRNALEEHFFSCRKCIVEMRNASAAFEKIKLMEANPILGKAFDRIGDYTEIKAASDLDKSKIREYVTKNSKFKVILRPLENNPVLSLLEVQALDPLIKGTLNICLSKINKTAEIDSKASACFIVDSSIDLSKLFIIVC